MRQRMLPVLICVVLGACLAGFPAEGLCRLNLPEVEHETTITGNDHRVLKDYFARAEQDKTNGPLSEQVSSVLLKALPGACKDGCREIVSRWNNGADPAPGMSVRLLYVEGRKDEKPARVLLAYTCFSRTREAGRQRRDERLAGIVVHRDNTRLSMLPGRRDCETCSDLTRIRLEKTVRIGGKGVVGVSFARSGNIADGRGTVRPVKEEYVHFYVMQDRRIKPAGIVLKGREENDAEGAQGVKTVYSAGVVFKKDMRGNIIGILSPYRVTRSQGREGPADGAVQAGLGFGGAAATERPQAAGAEPRKGLIRYDWNAEREEFVKE